MKIKLEHSTHKSKRKQESAPSWYEIWRCERCGCDTAYHVMKQSLITRRILDCDNRRQTEKCQFVSAGYHVLLRSERYLSQGMPIIEKGFY